MNPGDRSATLVYVLDHLTTTPLREVVRRRAHVVNVWRELTRAATFEISLPIEKTANFDFSEILDGRPHE